MLPHEGPSMSDPSGGSSESTLQLNVKTLDSRLYSFQVDKNIGVSAFKEKIASESGVPVGQQRLIFRGKVLKDDHLLSEYNVEDGDTLHLVERQVQTSAGSGTGQTTPSNGQDSSAGASRNRIGHIAHSVVLGTLNVGDAGEAAVPDLSRVIGAVLNSIGATNLVSGVQPGVQTSHGSETERSRDGAGNRSQDGNQSLPWQAVHGQSASHAMQTPPGAGIVLPSLNMPIPHSLSTLAEFMNRMELTFSRNGTQQSQSPSTSSDLPTTELPVDTYGLPTIEALTIIIRRAQRLLSDHAVPALTHIASCLEQDGGSNDSAVRGEVQAESVQLGAAMQHLGALFLELGRTILTLRMGQSPGDSFVNAGPAVYISPSGPNPIMVQPFPLQTSSLFGGSSHVAPNPAMGPVGMAGIPRNVNIHIHTGASRAPIISAVGGRAPNGEGMQGANGTDSGRSRQAPGPTGTNVAATAVPLGPALASVSGAIQSGGAVPQAPYPSSSSISSIVAEINDQLQRCLDADPPNQNHASTEHPANQESGGSWVREDDASGRQSNLSSSRVAEKNLPNANIIDEKKEMGGVMNSSNEPSTSSKGGFNGSSTSEHVQNFEGSARSNQGSDNSDGSSGVPLGLGLGGLQTKRRVKQPRSQTNNSDGPSSSSLNPKSRAVGQQVLQNAGAPADVADAMSEILQSPSLNGLLAGVSQQTGVGSPDMLRTMLQQFTQNPAMRNTVNQIAQQIDSHDLGSMFSGMDRGQGGGIDLSRMMQQMMPIVSQALGGVSSGSQLNSSSEVSALSARREMTPNMDDPQLDLQQVVQRLESQSSPEEVFRSMADRAVHLSNGGSEAESVVNELCSQGGLAQEFMEMLRRDISRKFQDEM